MPVSRSFEHHTGDGMIWLVFTPVLRENNLGDKKVQGKAGKNVPSDDKVRIGEAPVRWEGPFHIRPKNPVRTLLTNGKFPWSLSPGDERVIYVGDVWGGVLKGTKLSHRSWRQDLGSTSRGDHLPANAFAVIIEFANTFT
ncbi:hypothetical protein TNCV_1210711 [Trichonephila clavipes]|nr:hypothetical protein TNCV_1210711 [Trichonephila clavipes]